jgi:2-polyprenyl-3-methyl-5-hydroxy-6-metoxy-1,4-benzoquinol methylase
MDGEISDKQELFLNLRELEKINTLTGGPKLGFEQISRILKGRTEEVHIVDIGFGAGDMLVYLLENTHKLPCPIRLTGVDLMPETLEYVQKYHPELPNNVTLEICDYKDWFAAGNTADIVTANLFCHHLSDKELTEFFKKVTQNIRIGAVFNDLHRHPIAYYGIKIPTQMFSKSRFTKNDAPLSVLRGFKKSELTKLLEEAGVKDYSIEWKWAFRFLITIRK